MIHLGVTGTDTGVGKTVIAAALVAALREEGLRVAPMKPIETGGGDDAERLLTAAGGVYRIEAVRPIALPEPLAPLAAARLAGTTIDLARLDAAFTALRRDSDAIVVEGAGGLLVPITETETFATLFRHWALELVVVAANRLGALNHTLLTVASARAHGLAVRAVVLNAATPVPPGLAEQTNGALLQELLHPIPVFATPHVGGYPDSTLELSAALHPLRDILLGRPVDARAP